MVGLLRGILSAAVLAMRRDYPQSAISDNSTSHVQSSTKRLIRELQV